MKRLPALLAAVVCSLSLNGFAEIYSFNIDDSASAQAATVTVNGTSATLSHTPSSTYWGTSNGQAQIGSGNNPATSYTITIPSSAFSLPIVAVRAIDTKMGSGGTAKLSVSVGGNSYLRNGSSSVSLTTSNATYEFTPSGQAQSGEIIIKYTNTAKAFYTKTFEIETAASSIPQLSPPTGLALSGSAASESFTVTWTGVTDATGYTVKLFDSTGTTVLDTVSCGPSETTATFSGLTPSTTYSVSVVAIGDGTTYSNSSPATRPNISTAAPVTVPTLSISNITITDTSARASWTACYGVTSYTLQLASDNQFSTGAGSLTETFANVTFTTTSSSYTDQTISRGDLGTWTATSCRGDQGSPVIRNAGTLTSPTIANGVAAVEFDYDWPYNESGSCDIELYVGGTSVGTATVSGGSSGTATYTLDAPVTGPTTIEFLNKASNNKRMRVIEVRITTPSSGSDSSGASLIAEYTVSDTFYDFNGLAPATTYYARVKGNSDWSNVESFTTISSTGNAAPTLELRTNDVAVAANSTLPLFYGETLAITLYGDDEDEGDELTYSVAPTGLGTLNGTTYTFSPVAVGVTNVTFSVSDGEITTSKSITFSVGLAAPTISVSGTPTTTTAILSGNTVDGANGYLVTYAGDTMDTTERTISVASFPVTLTDLVRGCSYTATAVATNGAITSLESDAVTIQTFDLSDPANLTFSGTTHNSTTFSWDAVPDADSYIVSAFYIPGILVFRETFDGCTGTGGNDNQWSGNIAISDLHADNDGWAFEHEKGAFKCAKFGTTSKDKGPGSATTPALGVSGDFTLTFRAAAWNGSNEILTLNLSVTGGGTLDEDSVTLKKGEWTTYTNAIFGATAATKVTFSGSDVNNRFFLDDVVVSQGSIEPVQVVNNAQVSASASPSYPATGLSPETKYTFTVTASATVGNDTVTSSASKDVTTLAEPPAPPATTLIVF